MCGAGAVEGAIFPMASVTRDWAEARMKKLLAIGKHEQNDRWNAIENNSLTPRCNKNTSCTIYHLIVKDSSSNISYSEWSWWADFVLKVERSSKWRCLGAIKLKMLEIEVFHWAKASQGLYEVFKAKLLHFPRWYVKHPWLGVYFLVNTLVGC